MKTITSGSGTTRPAASRGRAAERGSALLEVALTLPLMLLVSVGIFEFGRAYQTWEVLTNAAREGARVAVLPNTQASAVRTRVRDYMQTGQLSADDMKGATVSVTTVPISIGATTANASQVTISYPFTFMVLQPVASLVVRGTTLGSPIMLTASAVMRNEAQ
jgi:Flp pilus assembly protein TadG